jgi:hypothetical protein
MRIEAALPKTPSLEADNPSWKTFFAHFSQELSAQEKHQIIEFFVQQLSHIIHHNMQRMIDIYKAQKREQS